MSTVLHHGSQHGCLSRTTTPGGGGTNLPVEHLVADDQAGGSADGFCEEVGRGGGGGGGGHSGEMAGDLGEAREHPEGGGNVERSSWKRGVVD